MAATIADIRSELSPQQNQCLRDYQIRWWIEHKAGCRAAVLKTIANQAINVQRVRAILDDPARLEATHRELNRRVLNVIRVSQPQRRVLVFINTHNKAETFEYERAVDALLTFLYYLQHVLEAYLGDGGAADAVLHMIGAPLPSLTEMRSQGQLMGATVGRSFPGIFDSIRLCCSWNGLCRRAACAAANRLSIPLIFTVPTDLIAQFGEENIPTLIGGQYDLGKGPPIGDLVFEYLKCGAVMDRLSPLLAGAEGSASGSPLRLTTSARLRCKATSPRQAVTPVDAAHPSSPSPSRPDAGRPTPPAPTASPPLLPAALAVAVLLLLLLGAAPLVLPAAVALAVWWARGQRPAGPPAVTTTPSSAPQTEAPTSSEPEPSRRLLRLEAALLASTAAECSFHLAPVIAKWGLPPTDAAAAALALCAAVSPATQAGLRRQWALAQSLRAGPQWQTAWASLDSWLTVVTQAEFTCPCGCGRQGRAEALADHVWAMQACSEHDTTSRSSSAGDCITPRSRPLHAPSTPWSRSSTESSVSGGDSSDPGAPLSAHCSLCLSLFRPLTRRKHQCAVCARQYCSKCTATPEAKPALHSKAVVCWPCASQMAAPAAPPADGSPAPPAATPRTPHSLRARLFLTSSSNRVAGSTA
eukprot:EG_transcript_4116